jgi:hypothetical protein
MSETREQRHERAKLATKFTMENHNSPEYAKAKVEAGFTKPNRPHGFHVEVKRYIETQPELSSQDFRHMAQYSFSKDDCTRWVKGRLTPEDVELFNKWVPKKLNDKGEEVALPANMSNLEKERPDIYKVLNNSGIAHGLPLRPYREAPKAEAKADDGKINIGDELGAVIGVPGSFRVTPQEYLDAQNYKAAKEKAKS